MFQQILKMRSQRDRFILPTRQAKERADAEPAKTTAEPPSTQADLRPPTMVPQKLQDRHQPHPLNPPNAPSKERAECEPAKTSGVTAFDAIKPEIEIAFRPGRVHFAVNFAVVSFLINDQS